MGERREETQAAASGTQTEFGATPPRTFGSIVRDDFGADSDVDLLVEFADVDSPGYADRYLEFAQAAEALFGRPVDLLTTKSLRNPYFKQRIAKEAVEVHAS